MPGVAGDAVEPPADNAVENIDNLQEDDVDKDDDSSDDDAASQDSGIKLVVSRVPFSFFVTVRGAGT